MSGRSASETDDDPFGSTSFFTNSENAYLQTFGSILEWPEEPLGFSLHARWIPEKPDHGQWYLNLSYQITDGLRTGMDYRPVTNEASLLVNWRVFPENDTWRPALILGTSNDDFNDVNSQSYYGTLSRYLFTAAGTNVSLYGGATYIDELNEEIGRASCRERV